ncbi:galactosyldiacylglycerol synthase [Aquincola sp. MAHUQ-54]|uniref:Galactosyldiacylglycerol synthase n=1 Tax=Aquincola agrisoli TaxID=3119538 RepID=A0AAW9Q5Q9_9BURK
MKTVDLVYFDAGGGHRAAAHALEAVMREQQRPWNVRLVHLREVLDPQGHFRKVMGFDPEDFYNQRLARGWTIGLAQELKLLQGLIRMGHGPMLRLLQPHWARTEPDLVVSLVPNFNRVLCESVARALPGVPYLTVMTDLADHPPHFWVEPTVPQHLACGTAHALAQARAQGVPAARLHAVSGMLLRPGFYAAPPADRVAARAAAGLDADRPVGVVMFGGHGSKAMLSIARRLPDTPLILMCGHNAALAQRLRDQPARAPRVVVGFTRDVPHWLDLADFFIGKPGPGSLSEAVQRGLPVITVRNAFTMPQERFNTDWVRAQGLGLVIERFGQVAGAVEALTARLPALRAAVQQVENRALFEVTDLVAHLLGEADGAVGSVDGLLGAGAVSSGVV